MFYLIIVKIKIRIRLFGKITVRLKDFKIFIVFFFSSWLYQETIVENQLKKTLENKKMLFSSVAGPNPHPDISKMTIWIQIFQNNNPDMIRIFKKSGSGGQKKLRHTPDPQHWLNGSLVILKFITIMNQQ